MYVHSGKTSEKVGNYMRYVPFVNDDFVWAVKWEVQVGLSDRMAVAFRLGIGQWVQKEGSVRIVALWLSGRTFLAMEDGWDAQRQWCPKLEANPRRRNTRCDAEGHHEKNWKGEKTDV